MEFLTEIGETVLEYAGIFQIIRFHSFEPRVEMEYKVVVIPILTSK